MSHDDPRRPSQTVPALPVAAGLSDAFTYGGVWTGQSNSLPWGLPADAFDSDIGLELTNLATGLDIAQLLLPDNVDRAVGEVEQLVVFSGEVVNNIWNTSTQLRFGTNIAPEKGYADVLLSSLGILQVRWISTPAVLTAGSFVVGTWYRIVSVGSTDFTLIGATGNTVGLQFLATGVGAGTGTATASQPAAYLVRENGKFASYENTRVLTPYMPWKDWRPVAEGVASEAWWEAPAHAPYPTPGGPLGVRGRSLILPPPYNGATSVAGFDDQAVFLPITRREGADGYGISEMADSTFDGQAVVAGTFVIGDYYRIWTVGSTDFTTIGAASNTIGVEFLASGVGAGTGTATPAPIGHPIFSISDATPDVVVFQNSISAEVLANAYLIVDWDAGGVAKRSWARITDNSTSTQFEVVGAAWLGDGIPGAIVTGVITWDDTANTAAWATNAPKEGDRVFFVPAAALPTGLVPNRVYRAINIVGSTCQLAESMDHAPIDFTGTPAGDDGYITWRYTAWLPHWKDNPFAYIPGPEFAYPNEDHQPRNTYCHFRARGRYLWAYNNQTESGSGTFLVEPFDGVSESRFGPLLPFAWRTGSALGKVMHMVMLGVGSMPLAPAHVVNAARGIFVGTIGWWSYERYGFATALEDTSSYLSQRVKRLVEFMAPQALLAESTAEPLRFLVHGHVQGEADGFTTGGRELYRSLIAGYRDWMRDIVVDGGMSPFTGGAKMPFVQPLTTHIPYEVGSLSWSDTKGEVNDAIREVHTDEEFSAYTLSDDLPKINDGHYSGGGMVILGARMAAIALDVLEYALAHGSASLRTATNERLLDIANTALTTLGQGGQVVTDLSASTTEARLLRRYLPKATEQLMGMRTWSWATRIESAALHEHHRNPRYQFGYVVPGRAARVTKVIPFQEPGADGVYVSVIAPIMQDEVVDRGPYRFEVQRSPGGSRILFTDVPQVEGAIETQIPIPSNVLFPDRLPKRPLIVYVDKQVNPDRYSPSFAQALTYMLAGFIAPALVRGEAGMKVQKDMFAAAAGWVAQEGEQEGANQHQPLVHQPDWFQARWE